MKKIAIFFFLSISLFIFPSLKSPHPDNPKTQNALAIFEYIMDLLEGKFLDEIDPEEMVFEGLKATVSNLDPYTKFYDKEETKKRRQRWSGIRKVGIGIDVLYRDGYTIINGVDQNSPAEEADLRMGDVISKVGEKEIWRQHNKDVMNMIKGEEGTAVVMEIDRPLIGKMTKTLKRQKILNTIVPFAGMLTDEIGYIKINNFFGAASDSVKSAVIRLKEQNAKKLILDFRDNSGGIVKQARFMTNLFIPKDTVVYYQKRRYQDFIAYRTEVEPIDTEIPLVLLTNKNTASASELLVGAMQDYDRGVVVGTPSFGKGIVQKTWNTKDSTSLYFTIARYHTPLKRAIHKYDYTQYNPKKPDDTPVYSDDKKSFYTTQNGRRYTDFSGITPDIEIAPRERTNIVKKLQVSYPVYDFANYFRNTHETIPSAKEFELDTEYFDVFMDYVEKSNYNFRAPGEKTLKKFKGVMEDNDYSEEVTKAYDALRDAINQDKRKQLVDLREEVESMLSYQIIYRYYNSEGQHEYLLDRIPEIVEAIKILEDDKRYNELLGL